VFGSATRAADEAKPAEVRMAAAQSLQPQGTVTEAVSANPPDPAAAHHLAEIAFADILVLFGVLLVGFAYLWRRGDLEWVRSTAAQSGGNSKSEIRNPKEDTPPATT
jgi:NADH-quinone oxidoreductase subunit A